MHILMQTKCLHPSLRNCKQFQPSCYKARFKLEKNIPRIKKYVLIKLRGCLYGAIYRLADVTWLNNISGFCTF